MFVDIVKEKTVEAERERERERERETREYEGRGWKGSSNKQEVVCICQKTVGQGRSTSSV